MPFYIYQNVETGETKEILQSMNEEHVYFENGVEWKRIWSIPQGNVDTQLDPFSETDFMNKTNKSGDTLGSIMDRAKEMSYMRAEKLGKDPNQQKWFKEYSKARNGARHPLDNN